MQTKSQSEDTKEVQTKSNSQKVEPKLEIQVHEEISETHSKSKELVFAKYVRRHHTPNQIIGDKSDGTMTRSKLKGT